MSANSGRDWPRVYSYVESLYPLLTLAFVMLVYWLFSVLFGRCAWGLAGCRALDIRGLLSEVVTPEAAAANPAAALSGRGLWALVLGLNHLACLATLPVAFHVLLSSSERYKHPCRRALLLLCVFALASALFGAGFAPGTGEHSPVLFQALAVTAQRDLGQVIPIVQWTVGASFAAAMIVGLTSCVLLWPSPDGGAHTPPELARRVRLLRTLLYFGTFVLVVVSLRFASELRWADDLLRAWHNGPLDKDDPKLKTLESLFSVSTSGVALTNTLTLAAIYVPAAFVLRRRASALAEEAEDTVPLRAKWLQDHGLTLSFSEQLPRVAALLAPLLAGPIGDIIGKLAK